MQVSNSFRLSQLLEETDFRVSQNSYTPGDIGGPMPIGAEYRWNVPVISYAFDRTFVEYFGNEGVNEVEAAIAMLNQLPAASQIVLTNYPTRVTGQNFLAGSQGLYDLKSTTLSLLLEQLGLAEPIRNVVVLRRLDQTLLENYTSSYFYDDLQPAWFWDTYFVRRNYDPESCLPSPFVNGVHFDFALIWPTFFEGEIGDAIEVSSDPLQVGFQAAADGLPLPGYWFAGLSRDDVGGLRYLLSFSNINFEAALPDVMEPHALNAKRIRREPRFDGKWRPGVEKITFVRHPLDTADGRPIPIQEKYTDYFLRGRILQRKPVVRVISEPDILFTVDNGEDTPTNHYAIFPAERTGTDNWANNAAANGNPGGPGPGVIVPPVRIAFRRLGNYVETYLGSTRFGSLDYRFGKRTWSSFGPESGPILTYPTQSYLNGSDREMVVRQTVMAIGDNRITMLSAQFWKLPVPIGGAALLQNSFDQTNWSTLLTITNDGGVTEWHCFPTNNAEVYRVVPE